MDVTAQTYDLQQDVHRVLVLQRPDHGRAHVSYHHLHRLLPCTRLGQTRQEPHLHERVREVVVSAQERE